MKDFGAFASWPEQFCPHTNACCWCALVEEDDRIDSVLMID